MLKNMVFTLLLVVPTAAFIQGPSTAFVQGLKPILQAHSHHHDFDRVHSRFSVSCPPRFQNAALTGLKMTSSTTAQVDMLRGFTINTLP